MLPTNYQPGAKKVLLLITGGNPAADHGALKCDFSLCGVPSERRECVGGWGGEDLFHVLHTHEAVLTVSDRYCLPDMFHCTISS